MQVWHAEGIATAALVAADDSSHHLVPDACQNNGIFRPDVPEVKKSSFVKLRETTLFRDEMFVTGAVFNPMYTCQSG